MPSLKSQQSTGRGCIFPTDYHLTVTTEKHVAAWDGDGHRVLFESDEGGIIAAKESSYHTGVLAVADSHVVLLRTASGEMQRRYKLKSDEDQVTLLLFGKASNHLYFSNSLQNSVMQYSIVDDKLTECFCVHPSLPNVVAISASSSYLLSASRLPPTVYLQALALRVPPVKITPRASSSHVTVAAFHPERDYIFLMAYADGVVSVHSASRAFLMQVEGADGYIAHLQKVHCVTNKRTMAQRKRQHSSSDSYTVGAKSVSITGAAFIPGFRLRIVTVAGDGRCRIIDFEGGANILRTWHVHAACTALAIYSPHSPGDLGGTRFPKARTLDLKQETAVLQKKQDMIAVGRADGWVMLYDLLGLLQVEKLFDVGRGCIIDLEWIPNQSTVHAQPPELNLNGSGPIRWDFAPNSAPESSREKEDDPLPRPENAVPSTPQRLLDTLRRKSVTPGTSPIQQQTSSPIELDCARVMSSSHKSERSRMPGSWEDDSGQGGARQATPPLQILYTNSKKAFDGGTSPSSQPCTGAQTLGGAFGALAESFFKTRNPDEQCSVTKDQNDVFARVNVHLQRDQLSSTSAQKLHSNTQPVSPQTELSDEWTTEDEDSPTKYINFSQRQHAFHGSRSPSPEVRNRLARFENARLPTIIPQDSSGASTSDISEISTLKLGASSRLQYETRKSPMVLAGKPMSPKSPTTSPQSYANKELPSLPPFALIENRHSMPTSAFEDDVACTCKCTHMVRQELKLLSSEVAALRKTIWVFSSNVGWQPWRIDEKLAGMEEKDLAQASAAAETS